MSKKLPLIIGYAALVGIFIVLMKNNQQSKKSDTSPIKFESPKNDPEKRRAYELNLIVNPETGKIPNGIYEAEREIIIFDQQKMI